MWHSIEACVYLHLVNLILPTEGITYLKGISTPKWTTRMIPLSKWLEDNNWRLAPYGNQEFTKIFKQYRHIIQDKYIGEWPDNTTDTSLGKYVQSLFFTSTPPSTKKLLKKDKIKLGKLKLIKEKIQRLEERLGLTTTPPSTTPEPTTEPFTGPRTVYSSFDPDYIFDQNWPLKDIKRLRRNAPENKYINIRESKVSSFNENNQNSMKQNSDVKPLGDLTGKQSNKLWIRSKRDEYKVNNLLNRQSFNMLKEPSQKLMKEGETKLNRFKREINELKYGKSHYVRRKKHVPNEDHFIVRRDLGKIVRRSTRRPHLSRKFKSQSIKRYLHDSRLANMLTRMQSNITIVPIFHQMKRVWDECARNNLSTLYYVYNGVGYFGSVPPDLLTTKASTTPTKAKTVTFELGATQVLGANIFEDEKNAGKREQKVHPADVDIPNLDLEPQRPKSKDLNKESKSEGEDNITETVVHETTKQKRTRKKKISDKTENSSDTTKKTRAKRKTTTVINVTNSLENSLEPDTLSKGKTKNRKVRSVDAASQDLVMEVLPTFLCFIHENMHMIRKRNANDEDEKKKIEDLGEKSNLGHFGKLKDHFKRSKNNILSFVKEKKESFVDMPRRARYIAKEMYLDGKFFFQELKEVPDRMKQDFKDKKEFLTLIWDMLKIFMPVTEKGEKGGTTPETKIVDDPKQYVKNAEDYITPDLSNFHGTHKTSVKHETARRSENVEETIKTVRHSPSRSPPRETEKPTASVNPERHFKEIKRTAFVEMTTVQPSSSRQIEKKTAPVKPSVKTAAILTTTTTEEPQTEPKHYHNEPVLVTDDPNTERTYQTRVLGPDYKPTNTRLDDLSAETTTKKLDKLDQIIEKVKDERVFDRVASTMKDKDFMSSIIKNADTERLKSIMGDIKPQDMLQKLDEKTVHKMGKLMTELDSDTIKQMQELVMKTTNIYQNNNNNNIVKTR